VPDLPRGGAAGARFGVCSAIQLNHFVIDSRLPASARPPHLCPWSAIHAQGGRKYEVRYLVMCPLGGPLAASHSQGYWVARSIALALQKRGQKRYKT
jgi:hypothetical protein